MKIIFIATIISLLSLALADFIGTHSSRGQVRRRQLEKSKKGGKSSTGKKKGKMSSREFSEGKEKAKKKKKKGSNSPAGTVDNRQDRGFDFVKQVDVKEMYPCVPFRSFGAQSASKDKLADNECRNNNCPSGCCREYNWLVCDVDSLPFMKCICNANTKNDHIIADTDSTTNNDLTVAIPVIGINNPAIGNNSNNLIPITITLPATPPPTQYPTQPPTRSVTPPPTLPPIKSQILLTPPPTQPPTPLPMPVTQPPTSAPITAALTPDFGPDSCLNGSFYHRPDLLGKCFRASDCYDGDTQQKCCLRNFCLCSVTTDKSRCVPDYA